MLNWVIFSCLCLSVGAQKIGTLVAETAPVLTTKKCSIGGSCVTQSGWLTLDASWRSIQTSSGDFCYLSGNTWSSGCTDGLTCAQQCELEGADYSYQYGIVASGTAVTLKFVTSRCSATYGQKYNVASRVFLESNDTTCQMFNLKNQEFAFDLNVSNLPCGLNGALYFVSMDADGGKAKFPSNKAGAKYGTGYCDSKCPRDVKFINGEAKVVDWKPGFQIGYYGSCCSEIDIWEANSRAAAYTGHPCTIASQTRCEWDDCDYADLAGICDKDGCDFNSYRIGDQEFFGWGTTVDTSNKFTVITQFITHDNEC